MKDQLGATVGEWNHLPVNRRTRKTMQRDGIIAFLFSGPDQRFTLKRAMVQCGRDVSSLLEIDVLRGEGHDMLSNDGVYNGLLRTALEGKLNAVITSPNCRARSLLRHRPVPGDPNAPRPVRS